MTTNMTRAIGIHQHGGAEVLKSEEVELPRLQAGDVQIRHKTTGLTILLP